MKLSLVLLLCCLGLAWGQRGFGGFFNRFFRPFRRQPQRAPQQQLQQQQPRPQQQQQQQLQQAPQTSGGDRYYYSWNDGITSATWSQADAGCKRRRMKLVSLRNREENNFIKEQISRTGQRYIWTGGLRRSGNTFAWSDEGMTFTDWSNTGGARRPQPDNREGNENCLAVLNNFYNDGIKWHDVACHHQKPYVCERA